MNEINKSDRALMVQVVSETLNMLPFMKRIVVAARYLDGYEKDEICSLLDMSENMVSDELSGAIAYICSRCLEYQVQNQCQIEVLEEEILKEAFELLLKQCVHRTFLNPDETYM